MSTPAPPLLWLAGALALAAGAGSLFSLAALLGTPPRTALSLLVAAWAADDLLGALAAGAVLLRPRAPPPLCAAWAALYLGQGLSSCLQATLLACYTRCALRRAARGAAGPGRAGALAGALALGAAGLGLAALPLCGWGAFVRSAWGCRPGSRPFALLLGAVYAAGLAGLAGLAVPLAPRLLCAPEPRVPGRARQHAESTAQGRFSLALALGKAALWLPMMVHLLAQHMVDFQSLPLETLSFLLTLLAATLTPAFVLSKHWGHLPCGCAIDCEQSPGGRGARRRAFEFNLSFQRSYGIYKIAHEDYYDDGQNSTSYHNLMSYEGEATRESGRGPPHTFQAVQVEVSTAPSLDSSPRPTSHPTSTADSAGGPAPGEERSEGPERRLSSSGESRKLELWDWEWSRSKSERTPRQRSGGALAVPLCAFQGTVSLQTPTGKTLSLSTYEVSTEGQIISPASKKTEVYRSKSVGHDPSTEDSPPAVANTSVKIHLEVLEICENEAALDTVSIISNISQSSAQVRSPSLRYSRRENRFVSCELGESASYSLLLPTDCPDRGLSISIPDTVEAHRLTSGQQQRDGDGYQEEIQLLNQAYRRGDQGSQASSSQDAAALS
ncbi:probable G-protein coupled receptor 149 [Sorex fumeus]|uniref:probable G-protein coupled receptor 149 n=1 Tax=Sorex fumeus TaxID=62283 RepID=UPI0024AD3123|nr:probable G-protein coupled receptor 149 [Sorex fumeus]